MTLPLHRTKRTVPIGTKARLSLALSCVLALACFCSATSTDTATAQDEPSSPGVRRVYVPIDQIDAILAKDHNGVILPKAEFAKLFKLATKNTADKPNVPAATVISNCVYDTDFGDQQMVLNATVTLTQLVDGWQSIRLPVRGVAVEAATLDGEPAKLGRAPNLPVRTTATQRGGQGGRAQPMPNDLILFSNGQGTKELKLTLSTPLAAVGSDKVAAFGLITAPSATLNVKVPADRHLYVNNLMPKRPEDIADEATYEVAVGGQTDVSLRLTQQQGNQTSDALVFATTAYGVDVAPGEVTWNAVTNLQLFGRTIDTFKFNVPSNLEIADVKSVGLESWDLADSTVGADQTTITLNYRQPVEAARRVEFRGIMSTPSGSEWTVPGLTLSNANSHVGRVLVRYPFGTRLLVNESDGVRATIANTKANSGPQLLYDIWREDFRLSFVTQNRAREVFADLSTIVEAKENGIELETLATLQCINAPLFELEVVIPAEWTVTSLTIGKTAVVWKSVPRNAGENHLLVELPQPLKPGASMTVKVVGRRDIPTSTGPAGGPALVAADAGINDDQGFEFALPEIRLPQSNVVEGAYLVTADGDLEIIPVEVTGLDATQLEYPGHHLGYRYQDTRFSGRMLLKRRTAHIAARTASYSRIDRDKLRTHFDFELDISGGGTRSLQVQLPEWTETNLRFQIANNCQPPVRIVSQSVAAAAAGQREWTIQFDRHAKGMLTVSTDVESPRTASGVAELPTANLSGVDRHNGFVAIEGSGEQQISLNFDAGSELTQVDPVDLPLTKYIPKERIVAAHRFVQPDFNLSLSENRFDRMAVPTAVVHQLTIDSVLAETGDFHHQAEVDFVAVGVQSIRLLLPAEADLWSVIIDGRPIEVRKTDDAFLISLPRLESSNRPDSHRSLKLVYSTQLQEMQLYGRIQHEPPAFAVDVENGDPQSIETLQQTWTVSYPDGTALVASDGRFQPISGSLQRPGLLVQLQDLVRLPRVRDARSITWLLVVITAVIFLSAVALRKLGTGIGVAVLLGLVFTGGFVWLMGQQTRLSRVPSSSKLYRMNDAAAVTSEGLSGGTDLTYQFADDSVAKPTTAMPESEPQDSPALVEEQPMERRIRGAIITDGEMQNEELLPSVNQPGQSVSGPGPGVLNSPPKKGRTGGGRLSVDVALQYPENQTQQSFQYNGTAVSGTRSAIDIAWFNRDAGIVIRAVVMAGVALLLWWFRATSLGLRWFLAVIGLVIPIAMLTLSPPVFDYVLDGVFFGSLIGICLWIFRAAVRLCAQCCQCCLPAAWRRATTQTTTTLLLFAALAAGTQTAFAEPAAQQSKKAAVQQPTVIVPYDPAQPALDAKRVFVSQKQFLTWWNAAYPDKQKHAQPNVAGTISAAQFNAKLQQTSDTAGSVRVIGRIVLESFRDTQITLDLPIGTVALSKATMDGQPAAISIRKGNRPRTKPAAQSNIPNQKAQVLVQSANQQPAQNLAQGSVYQVVVDKPGTHILDLEFELPAKLSGPSGQFTIPLRSVPLGRISFELPSKDLTVRANGSSSAFRLNNVDEQPIVELPIGQGGNLTLSWQPKQQRGVNDSVVHVVSTTAAVIDDAGLQVQTKFDYRVRQGSISEVEFDLPEDSQLKKVTGADVGGWESNGDGNNRSLKVFLRRPVENATSISVELYRKADISTTESISLPNFAAKNVTRETGSIGLFVGGQFSVRTGKVSGVSQINTSTFKADKTLDCPSHAPQLAWKFSARPVAIGVEVFRAAAETLVTANHAAKIELRKVRWTSLFAFQLKGAPRSRVGIRLPEKLVPLNVEAGGLVDWYIHQSDDNDRILVVEFANPRLGSAEVSLAAFLPRDASAATLDLNVPTPIDVKQLNSRLAVWTDSLYSARIVEDEGWKSLVPQQLPQQIRSLQPTTALYAYESKTDSPTPLKVELDRMRPTLNGHAVSVVTASDFSVEYSMNLKWDIPTAAADTFYFTTSNQFSGRIEFQVPGLRSVEETPVEGEPRVRWKITLQEPVAKSFYALATVTQPPPQDSVVVPVITFEDKNEQQEFTVLETQDHIALLVNQSTGQLAQVDPNASNAATPEDLKVNIPEPILQQTTEMAWVKTQPVSWAITRFKREDSTPASVNLADVKTTIAADGTYRTQAIYTMRNRSRQFLPLLIPEDSRLLSVFVANQPTRPVTTVNQEQRTLHLIALPKTSAADLSFAVRIVLSGSLSDGQLAGGLKTMGKDVRIPIPEIPGIKQDAEFGIPTARTVWNLHLPDTWDGTLIDESGHSNMAFNQDGGLIDDLYVLNSIKEANRIAEQFEKELTGQGQRVALTNINTVREFAGRYRNRASNPEIADELKRLGDNVDSINGRVQLDVNSNGIVIINNGTIDVNNNDEISINKYNFANNKMLFLGNSARYVQEQLEAEPERDFKTFSFGLSKSEQKLQEDTKSNRKRDTAKSKNGKPIDGKPSGQGGRQGAQKKNGSLSQLQSQIQSRGQSFGKDVQNRAQTWQALPGPADSAKYYGRSSGMNAGDGDKGGYGGESSDPFGNTNSAQQKSAAPGFGSGGLGGGGGGGGFGGARYGGGASGEIGGNGNIAGLQNDWGYSQNMHLIRSVLPQTSGQQRGYAAFAEDGSSIDVGQRFESFAATGQPWTRTGGLSLPIELAVDGKQLTFTKVSGNPMLTLRLRPKAAKEFGYSLAWAVAWSVIGIILLVSVRTKQLVNRRMPWLLVVIGIAAMYMMHTDVFVVGFGLFTVGALWVATNFVRQPRVASEV